MFNTYIYFLVLIVFVLSIVRTYRGKNYITMLITTLISVLGVTITAQISLFIKSVFMFELQTLVYPVFLLVLVIILVSLLDVEREKILYISISNIFILILILMFPILSYLAYQAENNTFTINNEQHYAVVDIVKMILRYSIYIAVLMVSYRSIKLEKIQVFVVFIVAFIVMSVVRIENFEFGTLSKTPHIGTILPRKAIVTEHANLTFNPFKFLAVVDEKVLYLDEVNDNGVISYEICYYSVDTTIPECNIKTSNKFIDVRNFIYYDDVFYIFDGDDLYSLADGKNTLLLTLDDVNYLDPENFSFVFYIENDKLFFESNYVKYQVNDELAIVSSNISSIYSNTTKVYSIQGHLIREMQDGTLMIDEYTYNYDSDFGSIQIFDEIITNGLVQFKEGEILPFGDQLTTLYKIDDAFYYRYRESSSPSFFINIKNRYDVLESANVSIRYESYDNDGTYFGYDNSLFSFEIENRTVSLYEINRFYNITYVNTDLVIGIFIALELLYNISNKKTYRFR